MSNNTIFLSAGDPSGDNATAHLLTSLKRLKPEQHFFGLGGKQMKALGQEQLVAGEKLAVLGFWEVARHFWFFRNLLNLCVREIEKRRPKAIVLVDYPGFNLRLAKKIKKLGIPIIYYISPQFWAWGKKRLELIRRLVDMMLIILPFEKDFFEKSGVNCRFVGHYLLEDIPAEFIRSPVPENNMLALLPGSRLQEVDRMLPAMLKTASKFTEKYNCEATIAGLTSIGSSVYENYLKKYGNEHIFIVYDNPRKVVYDSSLVLSASGTATLETAIIGRPMVVVYKTGFISYQIARRLVKLDKIALVNLVLNKRVVPELIQNEVNTDRIMKELQKYRENREYYNTVVEKLNRLPDLLGGLGASEKAARMVCEFL